MTRLPRSMVIFHCLFSAFMLAPLCVVVSGFLYEQGLYSDALQWRIAQMVFMRS